MSDDTKNINVRIQELVRVVDEQKVLLLFYQTLLRSIEKSMPPEQQTVVRGHFEQVAEKARRTLLYSHASEAVVQGFDKLVDHYINLKR